MVVLDDLDMAIPSGWRVVPGTKTHESGQSFVNQVRRRGDESIYALKRLKNVHRRERRERFAREVAAMDRLRGAGLALPPVVEQGLERKDPYFVMPWYERGSLQSLVDELVFVARPLDGIDLLVRIAIELQKLHEAEVAHRDLKPANVLLADSGPLLTDFGLCLLVDDEAERLTTTAEPIGSRFYIAPENESGINEDVDQRPADFYAFGKMTWVVLAGRNPFARELTGRPELRIRNVREDERFASLDYLLDELLDTDPRSRLSDWHDVIGELASHRGVLRGDAPRSRPPSVDQTLRVARRVRQVPAFQAAARRRLEDQRVDQWMHDQLLGLLTRIAAEIRDELAALTDASRGAVEFQMSGGGPDLATLVDLSRGSLSQSMTPLGTLSTVALARRSSSRFSRILSLEFRSCGLGSMWPEQAKTSGYYGFRSSQTHRDIFLTPSLTGTSRGSARCRLVGRPQLTALPTCAVKRRICSVTWHIDTYWP